MEAIRTDYHAADLAPADRQMLDFAVKLTRFPNQVAESDVRYLHDAGFDDVAVHDIVQVTSLFNYYNRLADGLGIDPEP